MTSPVNLPHHHHWRCRLHAAAALLHLLVLLGGGAMARARAQAIPTSCCGMFEGLDVAPCLQDAVAGAAAGIAGGNISGACCSSLHQAIDAGHRCLCSLLLSSNGAAAGVRVLASLAAALPVLPLALPLPGCLLYAPPVLSCQVAVQEQTDAPPAATTEAATATETTFDSPPPQAVVMPSSKKSKRSADGEKADDDQGMNGSYGNGNSNGNGNGGAKKKIASRSEARRRTNVDEGIRTHLLTFVVVMAAFWFSII
uniref:Bifunctional inhibitor/plant lipid transfer protein/seed storage helical domain-containing protein n=1 Tax=Oryza punctata TaxID=4537 RepID=A0A0E0LBB8_ORYPU